MRIYTHIVASRSHTKAWLHEANTRKGRAATRHEVYIRRRTARSDTGQRNRWTGSPTKFIPPTARRVRMRKGIVAALYSAAYAAQYLAGLWPVAPVDSV